MRGPSRLGHLDQYPAQILRGGERCGEEDAPRLVAGNEVHAFGVETAHRPSVPLRLGVVACIDLDGVPVLGVHVVERRLLGRGKGLADVARNQKVATVEQIGLPEAAVQAGALRFQAEDREISQPRIELRLGVAVEIAPLGAEVIRRAAFQPRGAASSVA